MKFKVGDMVKAVGKSPIVEEHKGKISKIKRINADRFYLEDIVGFFYEDELELVVTEESEVVKGVGKDAPSEQNENGGFQSKVLYGFDLLDPKSMFEMTKVLKEGADKYGTDNWRLIDIKDHLNHMIIHAYAYLAGDKSDDHLSHIMCRAMFAQAVELQTEEDIEKTKKSLGR